MSTEHQSTCFATNAELSGDPTNTRDLREALLREIRRRFREIRGAIRRTIGYETDAFGLTTNRIDSEGPYDFPSDPEKISAFMDDLRTWIEENLLEPVGFGPTRDGRHWTGQYIRGAYTRGWQNAEGRLLQEGVSLTTTESDSVVQIPVAVSQLRQLYTRTFENLRDITEDMAQTVREELTVGLAQGENPRKIANRINSEVEKIQKTRAEVLARTEVINSHSEATLDRYERAGVETVGHGEWATAGDDRVCPICEALEGKVFSISEMRNQSFELPGVSFTIPLKPPAHPSGRCSILPSVGLSAEDLPPLSERLPDRPAE